jgi:hypothetical protein
VPVYEIYKVGEEPRWLDGLDLLSELGISAAVIPHYDNAEGGHHDTRFCYLGERRLQVLEEQLPPDTHVIGVDEHTGVVIDLDAASATVVGNGRLTIRVHGRSVEYAAGTTVPVDALRDPHAGTLPRAARAAPPTAVRAPELTPTSLAAETAAAQAAFESALAEGDGAGAARATLALEDAITAWSADTLQSDEVGRARAALRSMIVRLGDAAVAGLRDPRAVAAPYVEALVALRAAVRAERRFDLSDVIRDHLTAIGVEVRDTRDGVEWELRRPE